VRFLERLETAILFRLTRAFSVCVILILLIALGISVYDAFGTFAPIRSYPEPEDVFARLAPQTGRPPTGGVPQTQDSELSSLKLPFNIQRYFSDPESRSRLLAQVASLPPDERDGYIQNLSAVIEQAEKNGFAPGGNAIYTYMQLTSERQQEIVSRKEALNAQRLQAIEVTVAILILIALFSLILVLLAIERNTRSNRAAA